MGNQEEMANLRASILAGDLDKIEEIISKEPNLLTDKSEDGEIPLMYAIKQDKINAGIVKYLIDNTGVNIFVGDKDKPKHLLIWIIDNIKDNEHSEPILEMVFDKMKKHLNKKIGKTTLLINAVNSGSLEAVKYLITKGANTNICDEAERTALHYAAENGYFDIELEILKTKPSLRTRYNVILIERNIKKLCDNEKASKEDLEACKKVIQELIDNGEDVNVQLHRNYWGLSGYYSSLSLAIESQQIEIAKLLLENGANVNVDTYNGEPLLYWAIFNNKMDVANLLIQYGADVNLRIKEAGTYSSKILIAADNNGFTLLHWAISNNNIHVAKFLLEKGAKIDMVNLNDELSNSIHRGQIDMANWLIGKGAKINTVILDDELSNSIYGGQIDMANWLIDKGANTTGLKGKLWWVINKDKSIANRLIEQGIDLDYELHEAIANYRDTSYAQKWLLEKGAKFTKESLFIFVVKGLEKRNVDKVTDVLKKNIDLVDDKFLNYKLHLGEPLIMCNILHYAAMYDENGDLVKLLIDKGPNLKSVITNYGQTPLHCAVSTYNTKVIKLLAEKGVDINAQDNFGRTVLSLYLSQEILGSNLVKILIKYGAHISSNDLNKINNILIKGRTDCERIITDEISVLIRKAKGMKINDKIIEKAENDLKAVGSWGTWITGSKIEVLNSLQQSNILLRQEIFRKEEIFKKILTNPKEEKALEKNGDRFMEIATKIKHKESLKDQSDIDDWNMTDAAGNTLLHIAAKTRNVDAVNFLLERGVNPDAKNNRGMTALDIINIYEPSTKERLGKINDDDQKAKEQENKTAKKEIQDILAPVTIVNKIGTKNESGEKSQYTPSGM